MFEKYLSLLPYNPGLIHQMGFYGRRMREEAAIRRTGMVFVVLAFLVQFFAVIAPPAASSAATGPSNDLINNGFHSAAQAAADCENNTQDYKNILANYDISCKNVANSPTVTIASTDHDRQLFSMGRWDYSSLNGEQPVTIDGQTFYVRYLWAWDKGGPASHYQALRILAGDGTLYYLLYGCGNLVSVGVPKAHTPKQPVGGLGTPVAQGVGQLIPVKQTESGYPVAGSSVAPGTTLGYRIYVESVGGDDAHNVQLLDTLPGDTTFVSQSLNAGAVTHTYHANNRTAEWAWSTVPKGSTTQYSVTLVVKVSPNAPNGEKICNAARVSGSGISGVNSNQVCMTVVVNAPTPTSTPTPTPPPTQSPPPVTACLYDTSLPASSPDCKACQSSTSTTDILSCVSPSKTASNLTQNVIDANDTTAQPGDVINYTLSAKNNANSKVSQYKFQENLGDVMVYADPTDLHGGTLDSTSGIVTWPAVDIAAGATATEQVTVKAKNPVPSQAANPANPGEYDLTMTNVYGNTVNVKVAPPAAQAVVTTAAALPNTGPGASLFIIGGIVMVATYFYSRSRLLAHESALAVKDASIG